MAVRWLLPDGYMAVTWRCSRLWLWRWPCLWLWRVCMVVVGIVTGGFERWPGHECPVPISANQWCQSVPISGANQWRGHARARQVHNQITAEVDFLKASGKELLDVSGLRPHL